MKNKKEKLILVSAGMLLSLYPIGFLLYVFKDYDNLIRYVGTEYDILMAITWLLGTLIFLVLSLYDTNATAIIRNKFGGAVSAYVFSMTVFSHQHVLSRFNAEYNILKIITILAAAFLIILSGKKYNPGKSIEIKRTFGMEIAVLSLFYYGLSQVVLHFILGVLSGSKGFDAVSSAFYFVCIISALAGLLCISRKRTAFFITLLVNCANILVYIALTAGTVYFGENIAEALESVIPGLYISITLIALSIASLKYIKSHN